MANNHSAANHETLVCEDIELNVGRLAMIFT